MHTPEITVVAPVDLRLVLEKQKRPFAVLLDTRDKIWGNSRFLCEEIGELLNMGCRYFVCFGPHSESIHDLIDDEVLVREFGENVVTTYHEEESLEDVLNFFKIVAMGGMSSGLIVVNNHAEWLAAMATSSLG